jgi:hypothetical protein
MKNGHLNRRDFVKASASAAVIGGISSTLAAQTSAATPAPEKRPFSFPAGQRQLFIDDWGVAKTESLAKTLHQPVKRGAVIRPDTSKGVTYLQCRSAPNWDPEAKLFKFWIENQPDDAKGEQNISGYYESTDGLHWNAPVLNQVESHGSRSNNYVSVQGLDSFAECAIYDPVETDPKFRYKGFTLVPLFDPKDPKAKLEWALQPIGSDGVTWKKLDVPGMSTQDEFNLSFDPVEKQFIATMKHNGPYGRSVFLSTSKDFRQWSKEELIFHADDLDQEIGRRNMEQVFANSHLRQPSLNIPARYNVDVYNMGTFRYEGLYLGMPAMFHKTGQVPGTWHGFDPYRNDPAMVGVIRYGSWDGFHHVQLVSSRDLRKWNRLADRKPFLDLSPLGAGAYDLSCLIGSSSPIARGDELWFYYTGLKAYGGNYGDDDGLGRDRAAICLAVLRRDGFMSIDAREEEGSVLTEPFVLPKGELHLNVSAGKGSAVVQLCDDQAKPIAGFEGSTPIKTDETDTKVGWSGRRLEEFANKKVCLRIKLREAQLYSYWIA